MCSWPRLLIAGALVLAGGACASAPGSSAQPQHGLAASAGPEQGSGPLRACSPDADRDGVLVAVLDSGVDATHDALFGRLAPGWDASRDRPLMSGNSDADGTAWDGHGTATAGVLASAIGAARLDGTSVPVRVLPIKVRDASGKVRGRYVAAGIRYAIRAGADVINMSLSARTPDGDEGTAVAEAVADGSLVVASVGNGGADRHAAESFPAAYPGVIGVGAVDPDGRVAEYSSRGPMVDLVAFGGSDGSDDDRVLVLTSGGGVEHRTGTSLSTPLVAAAAAALLAKDRSLAPTVAGRLLLSSARDRGIPGRDDRYGSGVLNAEAAQSLAERRQRACTDSD